MQITRFVDRYRGSAVIEVVNVYLDEMRLFFRGAVCKGLEYYEAAVHLEGALPGGMQEDYRKQYEKDRDPFLALGVNQIALIIRRDWDNSIHEHFADDEKLIDDMMVLVNLRNATAHPGWSDLTDEQTRRAFSCASRILNALGREAAVEHIGLLEHRYIRRCATSESGGPADETPDEERERLLDDNWTLQHRLGRATARLEGRSSRLGSAFSWVIGVARLSRYRGSSERSRQR